MTFLAVPIS